MNTRLSAISAKSVAYAVLISVAVVQLVPLLWLILFSLKSNAEIITRGTLALPETLLFSNYVEAWTKASVSRYFINSAFVASVVLVATLLLSSMAAYAIARMKWRLSTPTLFLFLAGIMVPVHVILIPLFIVLKSLNLLTSYLGIILPYIAMGMPLGVFVTVNFLRSMPREL